MGVYIDIALSLVFIYLVLSLVVSAVNELVAMWLRKRPAMLANSLISLIDNDNLRRAFYSTGEIISPRAASEATEQKEWKFNIEKKIGLNWIFRFFPFGYATDKHPSFIEGDCFARGITMALLKKTAEGRLPSEYAFGPVREAVLSLNDDSGIRQVLIRAVGTANENLETFEKQVADWYNAAQDRVSGEYARWAKVVTLICGALLVGVLNVDTIRIAQRLQMDDALREGLVAEAGNITTKYAGDECDAFTGDEREKCFVDQVRGLMGKLDADFLGWGNDQADDILFAHVTAMTGGAITMVRSALPGKGGQEDGESSVALVAAPVEGAAPRPYQPLAEERSETSVILMKLVGLLITVFAISFGAPFWFDMLSKIVNIRAAGWKPEEASAPVMTVRAEQAKP